MTSDSADDLGPDLTNGVNLTDFDDRNMVRGHVGDDPVVIVRTGDEFRAIGATCTHYGGPLDEGLVVGDTVRCPWHHACFSLDTGEALGAPAIEPVGSWTVERDGEQVRVTEKTEASPSSADGSRPDRKSEHVVNIGSGATGFACAEMLRRHEYPGRITIFSADSDAPYDRPQLSKQFLAGDATADDLPLKPRDYYTSEGIDLRLNTEVIAVDIEKRQVTDANEAAHDFDYLVLATGAEPIELPITGADKSHVHVLRNVEDCKSLIATADQASNAVIVGSGFIGLETAASLMQRGLEVHVVTLDRLPLEKVLGEKLSERVKEEHENNGVTFHTETSLERIEDDKVVLEDGTELAADLVVLGVGVKPRIDLFEKCGLAVDGGVVVDECLRVDAPRVYAGGDIAQWHDARTDQQLRVEHWVLAERHGQHIARNILDGDRSFTDIPFFWSGHHDIKIRYVGHAVDWEEVEINGDVESAECAVRYRKDGEVQAVAAVGRDTVALEAEAQMESAASSETH